MRVPNRSAGRGARRWNATPEAGSAFAAEIDRGVEAECCSGVEKPPDCADDLRFVPTLGQGAPEVEATSDLALSCLDLSTDRVLERSSSFTGVRRVWEVGGWKNGDVAAEGERKMLPSSSSIGAGCLCTRWEYRRCTGGGDLKGDWRKMSSCSGSCTGGENGRCLSGDGVNMGES